MLTCLYVLGAAVWFIGLHRLARSKQTVVYSSLLQAFLPDKTDAWDIFLQRWLPCVHFGNLLDKADSWNISFGSMQCLLYVHFICVRLLQAVPLAQQCLQQ